MLSRILFFQNSASILEINLSVNLILDVVFINRKSVSSISTQS